MKTKTIIFLIRKVDSLMDELTKFNCKSDSELDTLVTMYKNTVDIMKLVIQNNWLTTDVKQLREELNDFQYKMYVREENKVVRKYYERNYNFFYN